MERWFHPLVLDKMSLSDFEVSMESCGFNALQGNIYVTVNKSENGKLSPSGSVSKQAFDVTLGLECDIDDTMHNLILEINSSKLAYNISMEDVAKYVFSAFLGLPGNETWTGLKELSQKWKLLFSNYYKPRKSQIQLLLAIEDRFKESPTEFGKLVTRLVHFLYNEMDILEEEAILEWAATLDEDSELKRIMKPIVDWLQEDSGEESED
ncbi:eIF4-gamma/eIF5/eIF2-epsilon [Teladorsagia circumcincta]|uniref:eIF4-gamma/eIF5/eIF2-epsilon n=1 Tax=Teladorsagia circumcincta TaxID=45464 RepID=A0A2G9TM66_TELCI|nr:eIF4-gamma/eIF5/eIF2-epsilon [Teladorsagia circumcincta]